MTILSSQHMTIPINTICHSQLICSYLQTQHEYQSVDLFQSLSCTPHIALTMDLSILRKIPISLSYVTLINSPFSFRGNLLPCSNSSHSLDVTHPHLVLAVTAASHHPPALTLSPRYVNSLTVSTSSQLYFLLHCLSNIPFTFSARIIS